MCQCPRSRLVDAMRKELQVEVKGKLSILFVYPKMSTTPLISTLNNETILYRAINRKQELGNVHDIYIKGRCPTHYSVREGDFAQYGALYAFLVSIFFFFIVISSHWFQWFVGRTSSHGVGRANTPLPERLFLHHQNDLSAKSPCQSKNVRTFFF